MKPILAILLAALVVALSPFARAATISVTTTTDELSDNATCSLREAIIAANTGGNSHEDACVAGSLGTDEIILGTGQTYSLTIAGADEDDSLTGDLDITGSVHIHGNGSTLIQDAVPDDRVLDIMPGIDVELYGLTVTGGTDPEPYYGLGGGIRSYADHLNIYDSTISGNTAAQGGGIVNVTGRLYMDNCTISDNTSTVHRGGGLLVAGGFGGTIRIDIVQCDILNNSSNWDGGGISTYADVSFINLSTISGNTSDGDGGGVYIRGAVATILASTVFNNSAVNGGGVLNEGSTAFFGGTTFSGNHAIGGNGGAIENLGGLTLDQVVLLNNVAANGSAIGHEEAAETTITNSCINSNGSTAVYNNGSNPVDATGNWWGASNGPGPVGPGNGDTVTVNVDYDGWITILPASLPGCEQVGPWPHTSTAQYGGSIAHDETLDRALVAYVDEHGGFSDIRARLIDATTGAQLNDVVLKADSTDVHPVVVFNKDAPTGGEYLIAFSRNQTLRAWRIDADGEKIDTNGSGTVDKNDEIKLVDTQATPTDLNIAIDTISGKSMLIWEDGTSPRKVRGVIVPENISPGTGLNKFALSGDSDDQGSPDVTFDASLNKFVAVWRKAPGSGDKEIHSATVTLTGATSSTQTVTSDDNDDGNPAVAYRSNIGTLIVWNSTEEPGDRHAHACLYNGSGCTSDGIFTVTSQPGNNRKFVLRADPVIESWVLAWQNNCTGTSEDVWMMNIPASHGSDLTSLASRVSLTPDTTGRDEERPTLAARNDGKAMIVYEDWGSSQSNGTLYFALRPNGACVTPSNCAGPVEGEPLCVE